MVTLKTRNTIYLRMSWLQFIGLSFTILFALFLLTSHADADYSTMSNRLPDDSYDLSLNNGQVISNASDCTDPSKPLNPEFATYGKWGCDTKNYQYFDSNPNSHQYITLSNDSINDGNLGGTYRYAHTVEFVLYTQNPSAGQALSLSIVNRGISDPKACFNTLHVSYYNGQKIKINQQTIATSGCNQSYAPSGFPGGVYQEIIENGQPTGVYRAYIVVQYGNSTENVAGSQTSFHLAATSGTAKLGYYSGGPTDTTSSDPTCSSLPADYKKLSDALCAEHGWIDTYPTNLAKYHTMRLYFRPECSVPQGTPFTLEWDDLNQTNNSIQYNQTPVTATLYKYIPGDPSSRVIVRTYNSLDGYQARTGQQTENIGGVPGQPYAYMFEFTGISGGNGISFRYPFDSGDARVACPGGNNPSGARQCTTTTMTGTSAQYTGGYTENTIVNISGVSPGVSSSWTNAAGPNGGNGHLSSGETATWNYSPAPPGFSPPSITITTVEIYHYTGVSVSGGRQHNYWYMVPGSSTSRSINCTAACAITSVYGDGPGGIILAGGNIYINATLTNTSPDQYLPPAINGHNLAIAINSVAYPTSIAAGSQVGLNPGASIYFAGVRLSTPAPATAQAYPITAAPVYDGGFFLGGLCGPTTNIYQSFWIEPQAVSPSGKSEYPGASIGYETKLILHDVGGQVNVNTLSTFGKAGSAASPSFGWGAAGATPNPGSDVLAGSIGTPTLAAGDQYCSNVAIEHNAGYISTSGPPVWADDASKAFSSNSCMTIVNRPYFRVINGSIFSGGDFSGSSCTGGGVLASWVNNNGGPYGSGAELSATALSRITGFPSANRSAGYTTLPAGSTLGTRLTFANTGITGASPSAFTIGSYSPQLGGFFGNAHCISEIPEPPDPQSLGSQNTVTLNGRASGAWDNDVNTIIDDGGPSTIGSGKNVSIFVTGHDVYIKNDIIYDTTGRAVYKDIPSFTLVVTGGNIYIDPGVKELNGIYVAKKSGGNGGSIYTCGKVSGTNFSAMGASELFDGCSDQLSIYGAFKANQVNLMRVYGTVRNPLLGTNCSKKTGMVPTTGSCGAEVFYTTPEMFLANQAYDTPSNGALRYDTFTSLPPVL
jgi:hypothetical protein